MVQFAFFAIFLFASFLPSGWGGRVDPEPRTTSLQNMNSMCTDCNQIVELLTEMLSHQDSQHLIEKAVDKFCYEHPVIPLCMDGAKTYVHLIIRHFSAFAQQNSDICSMLGLCAIQPEREAAPKLTFGLNEQVLLNAKPSRGSSHEVQVNPICNFCLLLIKTIEGLLPKEKTEEVIENLMKKICDYLPGRYKDTCNTFVKTYGKKLIELLLYSMPPHAICTTLGLCLFPETQMPLSAVQTDCDSCKILALLSQFHLGHNTTDTQTSDLLQKICHLHPDAIPQCEGFVKVHGYRLLKTNGKQSPITACLEDYICSGHNWY